MTGKERAEKRKEANGLETIFQIGKEDIGENMISAIDSALKKRELIKLSVLKNCALSAKEAASVLSEELNAEIILCIGRKFVLYRRNQEEL
ncbi:MAG: YhbY family RNA-binding protein [Clostridia bacterium]|nr:YhbY family RNA-binding protein [Clostridia bacterium]